MSQFYVYILSSRSRTLYVGVTSDLIRRLFEHKEMPTGFVAAYRIHRLVYFEVTGDPIVAIAREKQIKAMRRQKKEALITAANPAWNDLSAEVR